MFRNKIKMLVRGNGLLRTLLLPLLSFWREKENRRLKRSGMHQFKKNRKEYYELTKDREQYSFKLDKYYDFPVYTERYMEAGSLNVYFWQDLWAARLIYELNPCEHYDIGSRVDGFIGHLASFRKNIHLIDVRPLKDSIPGVSFLQADAKTLDSIADNSLESVSALCSLEHFGLGRYGDDIDPDAWEKAMSSIARVVKEGGHAFISVPIGKEHVEFDAHRVFNPETVVKAFDSMKLVSFSCCGCDTVGIEENIPLHKFDNEENNGGRFGLFHFVK